MNCQECRLWIDDLLLRDTDEAPPAEIARHLDRCGECSGEHALALEALVAITPRAVASPRLKERILAAIPAATPAVVRPDAPIPSQPLARPGGGQAVRMRLGLALAAVVLLALGLFPFMDVIGPSREGGALAMLSQARAAEARLFAADDIVALAGEVVVEPLADAVLAEARWLPLISVGADGGVRYHQLKLGGDPKGGCTVRDESWYDPATRRFAHVLSLGGRPLFGNSYDGRFVHLLEPDDQGHAQLKDEPVAPAFRPPADPSGFLGLFALMKQPKDDPGQPGTVRDDGPTRLPDGTSARVLRLVGPAVASGKGPDGYLRVVIRDDNHRVETIEFIVSGTRLFTVRRARDTARREPPSGWDLAGLRPVVEKDRGGAKSPVRTLADMIRLDVTVEDMAKRADYPVYVLDRDPDWSTRRQLVDMLDLVSPPHRMFAAVYPAKDKRHVVLWQAHSLNANLGPKVRAGQLLYTSPAGVKVGRGKDHRSMAELLLSSIVATRRYFTDPPARDCTGYLLETPEGAFPALAVNGPLTDAELHGLVDSLVRARPR